MNAFPIQQEQLVIKDTGKCQHGRQFYELVEPLTFEYRVNGGGLTIKVPKGFETDFASIPRIFWPILPPFGRYTKAAIIHDYLYGLEGCSRWLADAIFREAMCQLGVPWYKRIPIYYAVRFFGGICRWIPKPK